MVNMHSCKHEHTHHTVSFREVPACANVPFPGKGVGSLWRRRGHPLLAAAGTLLVPQKTESVPAWHETLDLWHGGALVQDLSFLGCQHLSLAAVPVYPFTRNGDVGARRYFAKGALSTLSISTAACGAIAPASNLTLRICSGSVRARAGIARRRPKNGRQVLIAQRVPDSG